MTPNELVRTVGGLHVNLVKIDEEMRPGECPQTDTHTHGQTQNDFIICPIVYAIAMGQIKICCMVWNAYSRMREQLNTAKLSLDARAD